MWSLPWNGAPEELSSWWYAGKRKLNRQPKLNTTTVIDFRQALQSWWVSMQLPWRRPSLSRLTPADATWESTKVPGPSGLYVLLIGLSWWYPVITDDRDLFDELAIDITWVLSQSDPETSETPAALTTRRNRARQVSPPAASLSGSKSGKKEKSKAAAGKKGATKGNKRKGDSELTAATSNKRKRFQ